MDSFEFALSVGDLGNRSCPLCARLISENEKLRVALDSLVAAEMDVLNASTDLNLSAFIARESAFIAREGLLRKALAAAMQTLKEVV